MCPFVVEVCLCDVVRCIVWRAVVCCLCGSCGSVSACGVWCHVVRVVRACGGVRECGVWRDVV